MDHEIKHVIDLGVVSMFRYNGFLDSFPIDTRVDLITSFVTDGIMFIEFAGEFGLFRFQNFTFSITQISASENFSLMENNPGTINIYWGYLPEPHIFVQNKFTDGEALKWGYLVFPNFSQA